MRAQPGLRVEHMVCVLNPDFASVTVNSQWLSPGSRVEHMVFGAQPGLVRVNENQVQVEHMVFRC